MQRSEEYKEFRSSGVQEFRSSGCGHLGNFKTNRGLGDRKWPAAGIAGS
jgi:hypothetical protein